ncbi:MAG: outer membrane beta-barrel protein [Tenuifilaceae bacterium]|jgi:hypothetical protein|nr:outer membrane beta-barrel protein [Tenuifilaceae bacterium]
MRSFNEEFASRVKDAFSSYNADHLADAGWDAFTRKQAKSHGFFVALPLWAKAASIAILLSLGSFITYRALQPNTLHELAIVEELPAVSQPLPDKEPQNQTIISKLPAADIAQQSTGKARRTIDKQIVERANISQYTIEDSMVEVNKRDTLLLAQVSVVLGEEESSEVNQQDEEADLESLDSQKAHVDVSFAQQQPLESLVEVPRDRRTRLVAGLSGMVAAVEHLISDAPGVSVGLYAEHKLTDNISIRPGMALAKHSYGLQTVASGNDKLMYDALPTNEMSAGSGESLSYDNHMDMVVMEIPINFVFKVRERRKSSVFVSVGASSLIYLSQKFTGTRRYSETVFDSSSGSYYLSSNTTSVEVNDEYNAFSRADMFGLLNLSAGYTFPFTKSTVMAIEPFVQLPMGSITSNNMRMGFGGISLKVQLTR